MALLLQLLLLMATACATVDTVLALICELVSASSTRLQLCVTATQHCPPASEHNVQANARTSHSLTLSSNR
jgi:hypothetical protein